MTTRVYELMFRAFFEAGWYLSDEACTYIYDNLDYNDEASARHLLRYLAVPVYEACTPQRQEILKATLQWYLNCEDERELADIVNAEPDWVFPYPDHDPRLFYIWLWKELFSGEPWESETICSATMVKGNPPDGDHGENRWAPPISEEVLRFPRKDGLPPGTDAPPANRADTSPQLPRRPTDGARFFRWEDQAKAIKKAKKIYKKAGIQKVWIEFGFPIGEGYRTPDPDPDEVWETNYAIVRFRDGHPVDSYPDLRKGWIR